VKADPRELTGKEEQMVKSLPPKPNLEHLKKQAKQLLKSHKNGDLTVCETLGLLHRFADATPQEILRSKISLKDVQFALALSYGFRGWEQLTKHIESTETGEGNARITNDDINRFTDHLIRRLKEEAKNQAGGENIKILRRAFHDHSGWVAKNENKVFKRALKRIEDGTFGVCEECGMNIPYELLKDLPDESLCIECTSGGKASTPGDLYCDFCGKNGKKVRTLIAGPAVYICDECLQVCSEILSEGKKGKLSPELGSTFYCSFCGKAQPALIAGSAVYICDRCVKLSREILDEESKSEGKPIGTFQDESGPQHLKAEELLGLPRSELSPQDPTTSETEALAAQVTRIVEQINREKGVDHDTLIQALEEALKSAAEREFGTEVGIEVQGLIMAAKLLIMRRNEQANQA